MVAPAKTPAEVIARFHMDMAYILQLIDIKEKFNKGRADTGGNTPDAPDECARFIRAELDKWRDAGIKPE